MNDYSMTFTAKSLLKSLMEEPLPGSHLGAIYEGGYGAFH